MNKYKTTHIPVLLDEVISYAELTPAHIYIDGTLGAGGHAVSIKKKYPKIRVIGFDKDIQAIQLATSIFKENKLSIEVYNESFSNLKSTLHKNGINKVSTILLDLGISSMHIDSSGRGFTFQKDEPLHMNMSLQEDELTAYDIVNYWKEETLSDIIYGFGEEQYARRIAHAICEARKEKNIKTTFELVNIIKSAVPLGYQKGKIHPATKTFQAIRIAVNKELEELKEAVQSAVSLLEKDGRLLVISFHSLEDRVIKQTFQELENMEVGRRLTKKPITASSNELKINPRARSAKLRVFQRV